MIEQGMLLAGRYRLIELIGRGGMGTVYRAVDERTGGPVAVKLLEIEAANEPSATARLEREARLAAAITSPRVVRVIDFAEHDGRPFLVLEYVAGVTLQELLRRRHRLPAAEALAICLEIARALEAAYQAGIVHRDLKPQNIKLVDGQIKVLDFGIARPLVRQDATQTLGFSGTPQYSAPERAWSGGDIRADIYSLGVILYRALEGRLPFSAPVAQALLFQHANAPIPELSGHVPESVRAVVRRCLAKTPADRFQTPAELVAALRSALQLVDGNPVSSIPFGEHVLSADVPVSAETSTSPTRSMSGVVDVSRHRGDTLSPASEPRIPPGRKRVHVPRRWLVAGVVVAVLVVGGVAIAEYAGNRNRTPNRTAGAAALVSATAGAQQANGGSAMTMAATTSAARPTAAGSTLVIDGKPQSVALSDPSHPLLLGFDASQGQSLALAATEVAGGRSSYYVNLFVAEPAGREIGSVSFGSAGGPLYLDNLPATGRYTVALNLENEPSATLKLALLSAGTQVVTLDGTPVAVSIAQPWREAQLVLDGAGGQRLRLAVSNVSSGGSDCCFRILLAGPDGNLTPVTESLSTRGGSFDLGPLAHDGRYLVLIRPDSAVTGMLTVAVTVE